MSATGIVIVTVLAVLLFGQACNDESSSADEVAGMEWQISSEPSLTIGREGDPQYEFHRIVGVASLPDGGIVVADRGSSELRVFSREGEYLRAHGGSGEGPGEFGSLTGFVTIGDTIVTVDQPFRASARISGFHAMRGLLWGTTLRPENESDIVTPWVLLSPKTFLVSRGGWRAGAPPEGTIVRDTVVLGILTVTEEESQTVNWLSGIPNSSWFSYGLEREGSVRRIPAHHTLGPSLARGASGNRIWLGDTGTGLIVVYDEDGTVVMRTELPEPPRPFDEAALEEAKADALARVPDPDRAGIRSRITTLYSHEMRPATAPRFTRFTSGPDGEMWVECFTEIVGAEHCAIVLDQRGQQIGRAMIPAGLTLHEADRDRVIGIVQDEDGIERIAVFGLERQ